MSAFRPDDPATLKAGWGYWDTTSYPYKGCFRRAASDEPVTIVKQFGDRQEWTVKFADGRTGVVVTQGLRAVA